MAVSHGAAFGRRRLLQSGATAAMVAGTTLAGAGALFQPLTASAAATKTATSAPLPAMPELSPFPAAGSPFGASGRQALAEDALAYFVRQQGLFPGRGVFLLPAAPWFGGWEAPAARRAWDISVPAGQPLYLLAHADPSGSFDPSRISISINGAVLEDLAPYFRHGVVAPHDGEMRQFAVLDLVFAPPAPGRYLLEVTAGLPLEGSDGGLDVEDEEPVEARVQATTLAYDLSVQPGEALGALIFRHPDGRAFAVQDNVKRHVPDLETLKVLGFPGWAMLDASEAALDVMPEGDALPALREGGLVRSDSVPMVFRLQNGRRQWMRDLGAGGSDPTANAVNVVDSAVLGAIPLVLQNDALLRGNSADVFHVESSTLRKVPDWKWATDRRLEPQNALFVPDRQLAQLPQNSPHWIVPGGSYEDQSFFSPTLGRQMPHRVFLPPDYAARSSQRYPVLYLLHGMGGRYDEWSGYGVEEVANMLFQERKLGHMIIVAPQGGLGYWTNQEGGIQWADYVARDLVSHVDTIYRTIGRREARAIGGLSMGAHGAIQIALNYPQTFGIAGAHSPSIRTEEAAPGFFGRGAAFARRDPLSLVRESGISAPPRIWIDAGSNDPWLPGAEALHQALAEKGWKHEWHVFPGEHDGWYWGDHLWEYLPFYGNAFGTNGIALVH